VLPVVRFSGVRGTRRYGICFAICALGGWSSIACTARKEAEIERIARAPEWVLSVDDLRARVARLGSELGVATERVRVAARLERAVPTGPQSGASERYRFVSDASGKTIEVELLYDGPLEVGTAYVLEGAIVGAPELPERWMLEAVPIAVIDE
jgi:hypothetical protein